MRIWIDLANSPHVLFFAPLIHDFEARGHAVLLTARDFSQTIPLAERHGLRVTTIGAHGGRGRWRKLANLWARARVLYRWAREARPQLALSHNSYAALVAATFAGIRRATLMDYEHQPANHIAFRLADRVFVPHTFRDLDLRRYGATPRRTVRYPGLKEDVYLADFTATPRFRARIAAVFASEGKRLGARDVLVTVRPPATMAAYHAFQNPLFARLLQRLATAPAALKVVLLPRTPAQRAELAATLPGNAVMPAAPLDGPNLIFASDVVVSAGGTMVREAAALGVPAATIFAGRMGSVDRFLIASDRVRDLRHEDAVDALPLTRRKRRAAPTRNRALRPWLVRALLALGPRRPDDRRD